MSQMITLSPGEVAAMAERVIDLEDEIFEIKRDGQAVINELAEDLDEALADAATWRRYHDGARGMMIFMAVVAAAGWVTALVGWTR